MTTGAPRGPLAALTGVPGLRGALVRAGLAALAQTAGLVLLAAGLAHAVARASGLDEGSPAVPLLLAAAGVAVRAVAGSVGEAVAARDARRAEELLRRRLLQRLATSPAAVAAAGGPAPAAVLATTRLHDLGPALATYLPAVAQTVVVPPALLLALAWTDLLSAVVVAVTLPLVPLFMVLVGKHTQDATAGSARALDRIAAHVAELVRGLPVLVGLGRAAEQTAALAALGEAHRTRTLATLRIAFLSALVLELIATLSVAVVAVTVGVRLVEGHLVLALGLTALLLAPEAFAPLRALGAAHHAAEDASLAAAEARAALAAPTGISPAPAPADDDPRGAEVAVAGLRVAYPGRAVPALPPTDLVVRPGELVVLRGPSGSGKSTLLAALTGLTDPGADVGGVVVAGGPAAVVPQFPRATGATVADELRRHAAAAPGADEIVAEAYVVEALGRVEAHDLAGRAPESLSPGELQRVALARALVRVRRGARLLLLDEPTAHLDDDARGLVAAVLTALRGTVTVVLVTHDPVLAGLADRTVDLPAPVAPAEPAAPASSAITSPPAECAQSAQDPTPAAPVHTSRALRRAVLAGALSSAAGVALTAASGWLIVRAAEMPPVLTLLVATAGVRFFGLARAVLRWLERLSAHDVALRQAADLRVRVWRALAAQGLAADRTPGSALARVVGDVGVVQDLTVRVRPPVLVAATVPTATVAVLALVDLAAAGVVAAVLAATVAAVVLAHRGLDAGAARAESTARVAALRETTTLLEGLADLRAHGLAGRAAADLDTAARQAGSARTRDRAAAVGNGLVVLGTGSAAVLGTVAAWAGGLTGPVLAVVALAPLALVEPLTGLVAALQRRGALADAQARIDAVLTAPVAAEPADPLPAPDGVRSLRTEALAAGWPGGPDVLRGLDATARAGDGWLVLRGPSGSGKSTLLAVLMASLRPRAGSYAVDGVPADRVRGDDLRARMAWLPQEAHVFASSIRANLAMAAPRGELAGPAGEARMRAALAATGLSGLVATLPDGLDTPVGAGGTALSGGERRRLAAARALLADRDLVLLDEPTAHLDPPTAAALVRDLRAAFAGRVVVCVTHDGDVERPGDTVLDLGEPAARAAA
ncbi:thiol reductant ABC exporter subunit CydC [Blastococcus sp. MG754426]|uniref:thiol reductant ABC exporter subunit CydC n=1 Tax=unclassified Blastococcus TaxID=2619396 RepID=UPI001EF142AD|nr:MULTISPECIES: thiol reductant ABC exporter subunit CydC [unclassified Blastococcus]MCF6506275.1 thiol reductant ABC exporter subunit CydC [Blastococcus sp. MG754426]MCF6510909.1 thiol reductant ABC exporter subunit CydC [Blastococcus sp. MG754427]